MHLHLLSLSRGRLLLTLPPSGLAVCLLLSCHLGVSPPCPWIPFGYSWVASFLSCIPFSVWRSQANLTCCWHGGFFLPWQLNSLEAIAYFWTLFANAEGAVLGFSPTPKNGAGLTLGYPRSLLATEMSLQQVGLILATNGVN